MANGEVADSDISDFACVDKFAHSAKSLFHRYGGVWPVNEIQVEVVCPEFL